jgi:hypothetical protein
MLTNPPIMITFKSPSVFASFASVALHHSLVDLLVWFDDKFSRILLTSAYRPNKIHSTDSGIHSTIPLRAVDLRSKVYHPIPPHAIAAEVNNTWIYDPARPGKPVCYYHNTGQGFHFHLQVHNNTYGR